MAQRYERECLALAELAKQQLNLPKNRLKQSFESMPINLILAKIEEEIEELFDETYCFNDKDTQNLKRILEELGDAAACLVGLLAHLNQFLKGDNHER